MAVLKTKLLKRNPHRDTLIKKTILLVSMLFIANHSNAQFLKAKSIDTSIGFGLSAPYDENVDTRGTGFYMQDEYVFEVLSWIDVSPYAGLILTGSKSDTGITRP